MVSTRVAGIPEIIHDRVTGALVPGGDVQALAEALKALVLNPNLRLEQGTRAIELVVREFDAQRNARRLLTLLKQEADVPSAQRKVA